MGLKELHISEDLMLHLCSGIYEVIASPLPSDARVVGRVFNELTKVWELGIESASFDGPPFMLTTPVIRAPEITSTDALLDRVTFDDLMATFTQDDEVDKNTVSLVVARVRKIIRSSVIAKDLRERTRDLRDRTL